MLIRNLPQADDILIDNSKANRLFFEWMANIDENLALLVPIEGSGSPEGVVSARPGQMYFDATGAPGSNMYRKTTEQSLNTGWVLT